MNLMAASRNGTNGVQLDGGPPLAVVLPQAASRKLTVGMRASALRVQAATGDVTLAGKVELAEISGSDTFVHVQTLVCDLVAQLTGVHYFELGMQLALYFNPDHVYVFDDHGLLVLSPAQAKGV
jgi:glycerol transport system ATP-binding protein